MSSKFKRKVTKSIKRWLHNKSFIVAVVVVVLCIGMIGYGMYQNRRLSVDSATYAPLLDMIARVESKGNYNAYFGNPRNMTIDFTSMSVAEVMKWQQDFVRRGNPSSAVGRYQIITMTLAGLVKQLGIDENQKFDPALQDRLAIALLERRGAVAYVNNEMTRDQFAANLAMEWAALPKVLGDNPSDSYYAGDGLNRALIGVDEVRRAIEPIQGE